MNNLEHSSKTKIVFFVHCSENTIPKTNINLVLTNKSTTIIIDVTQMIYSKVIRKSTYSL